MHQIFIIALFIIAKTWKQPIYVCVCVCMCLFTQWNTTTQSMED